MRAAVHPGFEVVPDQVMLYCTPWPGERVRTSVPVPGKQSAVDQIRAPAAEYTVNTCSPPERSRVQATELMFVTDTPRSGWMPRAKLGAPVVAWSFSEASAHRSRP